MSGVAIDYVGRDVHAKFGDSWLNSSRIIRLLLLDPFYALCAVFNGILQPTESSW